ncbi:peptidoglycan-binding protein [Nocardioides sp. SLBN-35]|uniref:peptidoglycan-binding domain-containing protein n=1 Tax=Nocardioides sp. SLBN-35 TaxID=2768445 RepID=UPI0011540792|nr:peptidoglycan-binding domain-containing protein [Nocardioides sp. SLBN-35]TQK70518.1 hypothetical protein FBY23_2297 [Nocardioides sp. SLBN-35]
MAFLGADTDELREVGQEFQEGAETIDQIIAFVRALIMVLRAAAFFSGGASLAYAQYLETTVLPWLQRISMALKAFAQVLLANADAQDEVSNGATVDLGSLPIYQTPVLPPSSQPYAGGDIIGGGAPGTMPVSGTPGHGTSAPVGGGIDGQGHAVAQPVPTRTAGEPVLVSTTGGGIDGGIDGGAGSGAGSVPAGGGAGSAGAPGLGTGSVDGGTGTGTGPLSPHGTATQPADGGLGGATPGAEATRDAKDAGFGGTAQPRASEQSSYGAAAAIGGGAAAAGLGGAALAGRSGSTNKEIDDLGSRNGRGSRGEEVRRVQQLLTDAGYDTQGVDGVWGRDTERAYDAYRAAHPLEIRHGSGYSSPDGFDYEQIAGLRGNANVTPEFLREVEGVAQRIGAQPEHLLAAMSFETGGTFSPSVENPRSGATGLIQFMDRTATGLGTSTDALSRMTPTEQLTYVERYFEGHRGRVGDLDSLYTSILAGHPASGDDALFTQGTTAYHQNRELDIDRNGVVTAAEATAHVRSRLGTGH